jgi:hypothetical protein
MVARAKKIRELSTVTALAANDCIIVDVYNNANSSTTSMMTATDLRKAMVRGPYANDSVASVGGVVIGQMYYIPTGDVKVRLI